MTEIPEWADAALSRDLQNLRSRGESQGLEYKSEFPKNTQDLGKEIAAFATSNTGMILIGVSDSGELVGLAEGHDSAGRDQILERLGGISRGTVKPSVTPTAKFCVESDSVVLVIQVPKGSQPVYYSNGVPYVRHLTQSRPAEPHELIEKIAAYLAQPTASLGSQGEANSQFNSTIANILAEILVIVDEAEERQINPWLDMWRSDLAHAASEIRETAFASDHESDSRKTELLNLAKALDETATLQLYIGSGSKLIESVNSVGAIAQRLFNELSEKEPLNRDVSNQILELIRNTAERLAHLVDRSPDLVESGRIEELQAEASALAQPLAHVAQFDIDENGLMLKSDLRNIARELHLTETLPLYLDGGDSMRAIVDSISGCSARLSELSKRTQKIIF